MSGKGFQAIRLHKNGDLVVSLDDLTAADLPEGDVDVRVLFSSLNYKDALILSGRGGNVAAYPHVPGIDLVGEVTASRSERVSPGALVVGTGKSLGEGAWGGFTERSRLSADLLLRLPEGLPPRQSMVFGTAGVTALLSILEIERAGLSPSDGPVLVTGAGGGVGSLAVALLAELGWSVATLEKRDERAMLEGIGAERVLTVAEFEATAAKPLGSAEWAAAIDTVGGEVLAGVLRSCRYGACVAACGMVAGFDVPATLHPFFARAIRLVGIDSVNCPDPMREEVWSRLAELAPKIDVRGITEEIALADVLDRSQSFLEGKARGRTVVRVAENIEPRE